MTRRRPLYVTPGSSLTIFTQTDVHVTRCSTYTHMLFIFICWIYAQRRCRRLADCWRSIRWFTPDVRAHIAVIFSPDDWWFTGLLLGFDISLCGSAAYYGARRKSSAVIDRAAPDARDPPSALCTYTQHHNSRGSRLIFFYFFLFGLEEVLVCLCLVHFPEF